MIRKRRRRLGRKKRRKRREKRKSVFSAGDSRNTEVSTILNKRNRGEKTKEASDQHWKFPGGEA